MDNQDTSDTSPKIKQDDILKSIEIMKEVFGISDEQIDGDDSE